MPIALRESRKCKNIKFKIRFVKIFNNIFKLKRLKKIKPYANKVM